MDAFLAVYDSHPFWIWLALGCLILAVEAALGTEWLLWPAVSAGLVSLLTLAGMSAGPGGEIAIFAVLTLVTTLGSRRLIRSVTPSQPDINDRNLRLVGQRALIVQPFVEGRGRVFVSGAEWSADLEGPPPAEGTSVVVRAVDGSRLKVSALSETPAS